MIEQQEQTETSASSQLLHWEHSPRRHGLWTQDGKTRVAYIGLSHPSVKPTMYSWYLDWPSENSCTGETFSLRQAKKQVQDALLKIGTKYKYNE